VTKTLYLKNKKHVAQTKKKKVHPKKKSWGNTSIRQNSWKAGEGERMGEKNPYGGGKPVLSDKNRKKKKRENHG